MTDRVATGARATTSPPAIEIADIAGTFVLVLVFIAAAAGVANTMLMATFERTREFGMLLALGATPGRIIRLVVTESLVLGLLGALIGSGSGVALVAATHRSGIDYSTLTGGGPSELSFAGLQWSLRFYPTLAVVDVVSGAWSSDRAKIRDHMMAQIYQVCCGRGYTVFAVRPGSKSRYTLAEMDQKTDGRSKGSMSSSTTITYLPK